MSVKVLVTRPAGTWPALAARFAGTAVALQMSPTTVQVEPIDPRPGIEAIKRLPSYDWLVATSGHGVSSLLRRLAAEGMPGVPRGLRVAAVGPATAAALSEAGIHVELIAADASAYGLAASLGPHVSKGARVLIVRPEGAPGPLVEALGSRGATVDEAPLYRTIASEQAGELADSAIAGELAAIVFTAPSSFSLWVEAVGARREALIDALSRTVRVAIGPTTAERLASAGLPPAVVAVVPREDVVGDAIAQALRPDLLR